MFAMWQIDWQRRINQVSVSRASKKYVWIDVGGEEWREPRKSVACMWFDTREAAIAALRRSAEAEMDREECCLIEARRNMEAMRVFVEGGGVVGRNAQREVKEWHDEVLRHFLHAKRRMEYVAHLESGGCDDPVSFHRQVFSDPMYPPHQA